MKICSILRFIVGKILHSQLTNYKACNTFSNNSTDNTDVFSLVSSIVGARQSSLRRNSTAFWISFADPDWLFKRSFICWFCFLW